MKNDITIYNYMEISEPGNPMYSFNLSEFDKKGILMVKYVKEVTGREETLHFARIEFDSLQFFDEPEWTLAEIKEVFEIYKDPIEDIVNEIKQTMNIDVKKGDLFFLQQFIKV